MKIQNSNLNFQAKLNTASVLETTSLKIFQGNGIEGVKHVVNTLSNEKIKATGAKGYRFYAEKIGAQITAKYPKLQEATEKIKVFLEQEPDIKKNVLNDKIKPIIDELGQEIDITL